VGFLRHMQNYIARCNTPVLSKRSRSFFLNRHILIWRRPNAGQFRAMGKQVEPSSRSELTAKAALKRVRGHQLYTAASKRIWVR